MSDTDTELFPDLAGADDLGMTAAQLAQAKLPPGPFDECQHPGCDLGDGGGPALLPVPHHVNRRYCDTHQPQTNRKAKKPKRDRKPRGTPNVVIDMGNKGPKKGDDKELQAVEDRAKQIAGMIAALILLAGQPDDAADITKGSDQWAKSVAGLAEHEAWLRKLAAGGEMSARATAWVTFAIATVTMILPILLRHDALPANIKQIAATFVSTAEQMTEAVPDAEAG